eukprot:1141470-Pelagomonas_calceolata.AAC.5
MNVCSFADRLVCTKSQHNDLLLSKGSKHPFGGVNGQTVGYACKKMLIRTRSRRWKRLHSLNVLHGHPGVRESEVEALAGEKEGCDDDIEFVQRSIPEGPPKVRGWLDHCCLTAEGVGEEQA